MNIKVNFQMGARVITFDDSVNGAVLLAAVGALGQLAGDVFLLIRTNGGKKESRTIRLLVFHVRACGGAGAAVSST
jgi:hypothetical protein